ncbi:AAA family ATPase [Alicyclobacillus macrosporangiidus]|uniref:AAA domain-containing protein n=1 Tax=Alicyclobacillus macrosporangiidus TaxID=392015 RepID=A0A1I7J9D7_9BACL|nr:AAA family ATPase [Alicyclobacillus macrosporangiidus]SFU81778.1 AAA domain-containing protein [Alicyclobacillus macrosporangiidus]
MRHVFLIGPMGAGKTTVAQCLCERYGYTRYALAAPVDAVLDIAVPWLKGAGKAVRRPYLQKVGRFLREFQPNPLLFAAEERLRTTAGPLVIDDGRTLEEAVWAHQQGFVVIVLTAARNVRERRVLARDGELPDGRTFEDETEQAWQDARGIVIDTTRMHAREMCEVVWDVVRGGDV